jgi:hypothetical protein
VYQGEYLFKLEGMGLLGQDLSSADLPGDVIRIDLHAFHIT